MVIWTSKSFDENNSKNEAKKTFWAGDALFEIEYEASVFFLNLDPTLNSQTSTIDHHHLCHHFKPAAALLCSSTISGYWYQQAQASLCWPTPPPNILTGKTFCKTEKLKEKKQRWYAKFCSSFTSSPSLILYCKQISRLLFSLVDL